MHHEVFLALLGVAGDVVEARADGMFVRESARFLSRPQRAMIDRVLRLGHAFSRLQRFVRAARDRQGDGDGAWPSLYVRALAQGVERVLDQYADEVARLEAKVLATGVVFPIPSMMFELADYVEVLPELTAFVGMLEAAAKGTNPAGSTLSGSSSGDTVGGAVLLGALHKKTGSGFPRVRECFQQLLFACHSVLYKQMLAWMLYGEILDPFDEFFIKRDDSKRPGSSSATLQQNEHHHEASGVPSDAFRWQRQFSMDLNAVPTLYFPPAVAEKVFFIGKAVHILSLSNELTPAEAHEIARIMSQVAQRREFDALVLEQAVERIRVEIARRLHDLVVVRSGFARFLEMLKDFFLLTRGEIFHAFIERSFLQMLQKPTSKSEDDINYGMWQPTVREFTPTVGVSDKVDQTSAWVQRFRLKLPLQTFVLRGFTASDDLVLSGLVRSGRNGKSLVVASPTASGMTSPLPLSSAAAEDQGHSDPILGEDAPCGAAWWRHVQLDASALSSEFSIQFRHQEPSNDSDASGALDLRGDRPCKVALLLRNDSGKGSPLLHNGAFSIVQSVGAVFVAIQLDIEMLAAPDSVETAVPALTDAAFAPRASAVRVVCRVTPSRGGDKDVRVSSPVEISLDVNANSASARDLLNCRVEYARQEVRAPTSLTTGTAGTPHVMYKKVIAVFVNDMLVLQSPLDLQDALRLSASNSDYWVGLALSEGVSVAAWGLDKFASRATTTVDNTGSGQYQHLSERNEPLAARELWRALSLHCDVPWPLQLLVPSDLLRSYSQVFQFCFRLKRVTYALERAWKCDVLRASAAASALRGRMSFVVRNLELHFHVSVIESRYSQCTAQLSAATDFDRVKRIHEAFVASVVKGCYVHTKTVTAAIDEVLGVCWQFAEYALRQESLATPLSPDRVAVLADEFHRRFEFLNGVLQIAEARELLFLLEFNDFFADERARRRGVSATRP